MSWKVDEWMRQKSVRLEHNSFFESGVEGVLSDLDAALDLPEDIYIVNKYQMTFDADGTIQSIYTFLYGKDDDGETKTYLIDYDADKSEHMTIRIDGVANKSYEEEMRLEPMLTILQKADCKQKVTGWSKNGKDGTYEILYFGKRAFESEEGLQYLSGDVNGDGMETGTGHFMQLRNGGKIVGFEVSLHIPADESVTPVRYIMEPEYISRQEVEKEQQMQQAEEAKDTETWTVDRTDGSMYFFCNDKAGWRLVITDAAAGSRFYEMERSMDGGLTWETINTNPFDGAIGVAEGLQFLDETVGFAGLTGASQSYSQLYVTRDGGVTFRKVQLPMETAAQLPEIAQECAFTITDFDYLHMPQEETTENGERILTIKVSTEAAESEGILFQSKDSGATWRYVGVTEKNHHF
uniref:WD40/YVTN/BNR-like repeat-containing protein n=1 Tax=Agathobacter sp. TaxID=2021311 RepID=UPI004056666F